MDKQLNPEEREIIKLIGFFKKKAHQLLEENKLPEEYHQLIETSDKFVEQIYLHAQKRATILEERAQLQSFLKDNASCPKCGKAEKLKLTGTDRSPQGWESNKYKCRSCNIEFVWNAPNNPWDMIPYIENFVMELRKKMEGQPENNRGLLETAIADMETNVAKLKPIVEASDQDFADLEAREKEMAEVIHKFKKHLKIEKIRMED